MALTYTDPKILDLAYDAAQILRRDSIYYSWTELKMVAEQLSQTEPNLDSTMLAEFYELHS